MEKLSKIGSYELLAEPFHCDFSHHLFMGHLGNHLLNAADFHSNDRGYGMTFLNPIHRTWVLSRLAIEMNEMPEAYDRFTVDTWVDAVMRYFTSRNFRISKGSKTIGYGRSIWAMIDTDTRQPVDILNIRNGLITQYVDTDTPCPIEKSSRVKMTETASLVQSIATHYSDVDMNGHINEIAYVAESHCGDTLNLYQEETDKGEFCVRITKRSNATAEETEVVRSKIKFIKE